MTAIVEVCRWFDTSDAGRPSSEGARSFGWSARHRRRLFRSVLGVSTGSCRCAGRTAVLWTPWRREAGVGHAFSAAGLWAAGSFYDGGARLGMPAGACKAGASGEALRYTVFPTTVGHVLAATTNGGVAAVSIGQHTGDQLNPLHREYPAVVAPPGTVGWRRATRLSWSGRPRRIPVPGPRCGSARTVVPRGWISPVVRLSVRRWIGGMSGGVCPRSRARRSRC